ncbi:Dimethylaniline Monooxygenase [N-Oxide-Forming] 6-Like [Manis pentadactyla]|nr:Dimethylaniline Monooxygenase [N-Oxide-Forming] 6-Like [Manis pentadactyla]
MIIGNFEYECYKGIVVLDIHKSHGRAAPVFHTRLLCGSLWNSARVKQCTDTNMQFGASEFFPECPVSSLDSKARGSLKPSPRRADSLHANLPPLPARALP